jgi:hypothetical protein
MYTHGLGENGALSIPQRSMSVHAIRRARSRRTVIASLSIHTLARTYVVTSARATAEERTPTGIGAQRDIGEAPAAEYDRAESVVTDEEGDWAVAEHLPCG